MRIGLFAPSKERRGLLLDPRTKLLLLVTVSTFVMGGLGGDRLSLVVPALCLLTFLLLVSALRFRAAFFYVVSYGAAYAVAIWLLPATKGILHFLLLGCTGILIRVMPGIVMGYYVISTTTVSEFIAAMERMHVTEKITIPLAVMFRFFPTVGEEFSSINIAMRMRGISLGGGRASKMLEYRIVPLLACSARIGEELSAAALTRGLGGDIRRTNVCRIAIGVVDVVLIVLCCALFAVVVYVSLSNFGR